MTAIASPSSSPSNVQTPGPVLAVPAKPAPNRRSRAEEAELVRARKTCAALPKLLPGIAKKDAQAAKVRIDRAWLALYRSTIEDAEAAASGRAVGRVDLRKATATERGSAAELATLLLDVRERVATHNPDDLNAQRAYGRGVILNANRTGATLALASSVLQAWNGQWKSAARDAGITQATINKIQALHDVVASADTEQLGVLATNAGGTIERAALFATLRTMSNFAVRVARNVFGKASREVQSLSDPRPLTSRGAARKATTKAKKVAVKAATKAKKAAKPRRTAAAVKRRAKRAAVATQRAALAAGAKKKARK